MQVITDATCAQGVVVLLIKQYLHLLAVILEYHSPIKNVLDFITNLNLYDKL